MIILSIGLSDIELVSAWLLVVIIHLDKMFNIIR